MSSYDRDPPHEQDGLISPEEFKESMRLVRLQIAIPISVLIALGANLVCALAIKPGLAGINALNPTLLSPNSLMVGLYWGLLFVLQVGFCLLLLVVRKTETKHTLVHGIGLRFAIANWIQAAWAVAFTLQLFVVSEVLILINVINLISIHLTLLKYPQTLKRPLDTVLIHAPTTLLLAILFQLDWLHNGFIALDWVVRDNTGRHKEAMAKYTWQAVIGLGSVNVVTALYTGFRRQYFWTIASEWLLFTLLFATPRSQPTLPSTSLPKPTALLVTIIICLVLHPLALLAGIAWQKTRERDGRIRLEEEVHEAEEEEHRAEVEAAAERGARRAVAANGRD